MRAGGSSHLTAKFGIPTILGYWFAELQTDSSRVLKIWRTQQDAYVFQNNRP